ncbi:hypothetical protein, partial [Mycobacterium tuberculosis]|uniref:hypothetical protein n=1 Tax=Mycobacterium tuberculosis TaxID=1773 RepID=UPI001F366AE1
RTIHEGGVSVNNIRVDNEEWVPQSSDFLHGRSRRISPWDPRTSRTWWLGSANPFHPGDTPLSTT